MHQPTRPTRSKLRLALIALACIVVVVIGAIAALQIDDPLRPEVTAWLERAEPENDSEAFAVLMGMASEPHRDALTAGREVLARIRSAEDDALAQPHASTLPELPAPPIALPVPEGELFCPTANHACIASLPLSGEAVDTALDEHAVLLARYQRFLALDDDRMLTRPLLVEPYPSWRHLLRANRLAGLALTRQFASGQTAEAAAGFEAHIEALRGKLRRADTLIAKSIFALALAENLELYARTLAAAGYPRQAEISPLSEAERSLARPMLREHWGAWLFYAGMDRHPHLVSQDLPLSGWITRMFFKPHMSMNAAYPRYRQTVDHARLSPAEFAQLMVAPPSVQVEAAWIRNHVGSVLNNIAIPDFNIYIAQLHDLNARIALFNQIMAHKGKPPLTSLRNPYYDAPGHASLSDDDLSICLDGPLPDEKGLRCLPIGRR